jgi:hypothetical protein|tara:strand:- start:3503 stop:3652 length:150 start_codon:yes stop_codon:yes gene_type:complete
MKKYQPLMDIVESLLDEQVSVKSVLVTAGALTVGAIIWRLVQKRKRDGD